MSIESESGQQGWFELHQENLKAKEQHMRPKSENKSEKGRRQAGTQSRGAGLLGHSGRVLPLQEGKTEAKYYHRGAPGISHCPFPIY